MLNIILFEPEIPPNTGNIIRLCANSGATLHLIEPLGFDLGEKQCRRAGLDYHEWSSVKVYKNYRACMDNMMPDRVFACTTKAKQHYDAPDYQDNDAFIFGPETRGLPDEILQTYPNSQKIRIPMKPHSRSLNLSNATAIILYEAWRQLLFS
ncbi:MAG: tRNA (cytidine(34)-2'-O)-methyltransferase [Gammaproteobacteria bacterium]|nr:tRNA (cytidine(34)-2'-O)-methyltransferase [Gammaproteobacteria bacterium]MCH9743599.1 tRNA (cytidine(34)-2'-O)-methyltransferase [Gammaproteobacteria bacterium]